MAVNRRVIGSIPIWEVIQKESNLISIVLVSKIKNMGSNPISPVYLSVYLYEYIYNMYNRVTYLTDA